MIPNIGNVGINNSSIPNVGIGIVGVKGIGNVNTISSNSITVADARIWTIQPPNVYNLDPPVVVNIGKPIVNMPGCVKVNKQNTGRDPSKNKELVNDDPKGNTVLCDGGMPYFNPPEYQYDRLTWQTFMELNQKQEE